MREYHLPLCEDHLLKHHRRLLNMDDHLVARRLFLHHHPDKDGLPLPRNRRHQLYRNIHSSKQHTTGQRHMLRQGHQLDHISSSTERRSNRDNMARQVYKQDLADQVAPQVAPLYLQRLRRRNQRRLHQSRSTRLGIDHISLPLKSRS